MKFKAVWRKDNFYIKSVKKRIVALKAEDADASIPIGCDKKDAVKNFDCINNYRPICKVRTRKNHSGKNKFAILLAFIIAALTFVSPSVCYALSDVDFSDRADDVDFSAFEEYIDSLDENQKHALGFDSVKDLIKKLLNGESETFFENFYSTLGISVAEYFFGFLPSFLAILLIAVLTAILSQAVSGFKQKSTQEVVRFVSFGAIATILLVIIGSVSSMCVSLLLNVKKICSFLFPPLLTILSALGGHTTNATLQPFMAVLSGGIITLINSLILPIFLATAVLSIVGNLSKEVRLDKLAKSFKSFGSYVLGGVFSLFITFITAQGIATSAFDSVTFNASKFMVSSYVPVLGGYLSDGYDLAYAGIVLLKNSIGLVGTLILIATVAFPVCKMLVLSLCLKFTAALIEPLGEKRISDMLMMMSKNVSLLISAVIGVAFMFLILIMLTISSCNMGAL